MVFILNVYFSSCELKFLSSMSSSLHRKILSKRYKIKMSDSETSFSVLTYCNKLKDYVSKQRVTVGRLLNVQKYMKDLKSRTGYPGELDSSKLNFRYQIAVKVNAKTVQAVVNAEDVNNPIAQAFAAADEESHEVKSKTSDVDIDTSSEEELSSSELSHEQTKTFAEALQKDLNVLIPRAGKLNPALEKRELAEQFLRFALSIESEKRIREILSAKRAAA